MKNLLFLDENIVRRILFHPRQNGRAAKADEAIFLLGCCLSHKYEKHLPLL